MNATIREELLQTTSNSTQPKDFGKLLLDIINKLDIWQQEIKTISEHYQPTISS